MKAVILAGGFGNRLKPLTNDTPKPMLPICNVPMIDYCISQAVYNGIDDITLTLAYKPEQIMEWCEGYGEINFRYSVETSPLGTFGGVRKTLKELGETFFVLSGDGLSDVDLSAMAQAHRASGADITIAVANSAEPSQFGVVESDEYGFVKNFYEKPAEFHGNVVNTGIYIINREVMEILPEGNYDFAKDLFPECLKQGKIGIFRHEGYWSDIGNPSSYYSANYFVKQGAVFPSLPNVYKQRPSLIKEKTLIGSGTVVAGDVTNSIIGKNCRVQGEFKNCIVTDGTIAEGEYYDAVVTPYGALPVSAPIFGYSPDFVPSDIRKN